MSVSSDPWLFATGLFLSVVVALAVAAHAFPAPMAPGSGKLIVAHLTMAAITGAAGYAAYALAPMADPYPYGMLYSGALMVLCVECWFTEDPKLFNGSLLRGWPFFLFHRPGGQATLAEAPMRSYTRVFSAWHAGGVCLCFFVHVLGRHFPAPCKAQVSLALGLLFVIWATSNSWRFVYGGAQFCQVSIGFHSLFGPGCGLAGYWHLAFWHAARESGALTADEGTLWAAFGVLAAIAVATAAFGERREAPADAKGGAPLLAAV